MQLFLTAFLLVRSAWVSANGWKFRAIPNSGNRTVQGEGVRREGGTERSWRQTSGLTDRNLLQGICPWVRLPNKLKLNGYSKCGRYNIGLIRLFLTPSEAAHGIPLRMKRASR